MVSLFRLLGVSAKHLSEDVSTTVSQKETTGSATEMKQNDNKIYMYMYNKFIPV